MMATPTDDDRERANEWWARMGFRLSIEELATFRAEARADERERVLEEAAIKILCIQPPHALHTKLVVERCVEIVRSLKGKGDSHE